MRSAFELGQPMIGIGMLQKFGLLKYIIPELEEGIGCEQGGAHKYNVFEHLLQALQHAADKNWSLEIRIAALFHDIGKPQTYRKLHISPSLLIFLTRLSKLIADSDLIMAFSGAFCGNDITASKCGLNLQSSTNDGINSIIYRYNASFLPTRMRRI